MVASWSTLLTLISVSLRTRHVFIMLSYRHGLQVCILLRLDDDHDISCFAFPGYPDFIAKNREALECVIVRQALAGWIDLVFGAKSRGPAAELADNGFCWRTLLVSFLFSAVHLISVLLHCGSRPNHWS